MTLNVNDQDSSFDDHLCYSTGQWNPYRELRISVDDVGFRQGVVAVERLRTYQGKPFQIDAHLNRWQHTIDTLHIERVPDAQQITNLVAELLDRNTSLVRQQQDVGITIFATPGVNQKSVKQSTFALHLNGLNHDLISKRCQQGQPLVITDVQQPSEKCWPRSIKVRSRIHYYLADTQASKQDPDAVGVLVDSEGNITETSIANLAIVQAGQIVSPPSDVVLGGITQMFVEPLAHQLGIDWQKRPISREQFAQADEILLMGTDGGVWYANSVSGETKRSKTSRIVYDQLAAAFRKQMI